MNFDSILEDIRSGKPVLVYDFDDRERECDLTVASQFVTPEVIQMMRKDAGGLICVTTPYSVAKEIGLPFMSDVYWDDCGKYPLLKDMAPTDIPYDRTKSSFGLTINHRKTYTGITDKDRALTASEYAKVLFSGKSTEEIRKDIGVNFRAPGHIHLLNTSEKILESRFGHTELCTALMYMAGVYPSATICEMMGDDFGSRPKDSVAEYAKEKGIQIIDGDQVIAQWKEFKKDHTEL